MRCRGAVAAIQNPRVSVQNVPVCPSKTSRVCRHHALMLKHKMCGWCRYTRGRFECTHGGVFESHTRGFCSVSHHNTRHNHTRHTRQQQPQQHSETWKEDGERRQTISMILFRNVSLFPEENQQPVFAVSPFFRRKVAIFIGRETNTHILTDENQRKKFAKVSPSNNNCSFRMINHSTATTTTTTRLTLLTWERGGSVASQVLTYLGRTFRSP